MSDLIKDGSIERLVLVFLVFGSLAFVVVTGRTFDERLYDIAFVIIGFYFGTTIQRAINGR